MTISQAAPTQARTVLLSERERFEGERLRERAELDTAWQARALHSGALLFCFVHRLTHSKYSHRRSTRRATATRGYVRLRRMRCARRPQWLRWQTRRSVEHRRKR